MNVHNEAEILDWDKPFAEQSEIVRGTLTDLGERYQKEAEAFHKKHPEISKPDNLSGKSMYRHIEEKYGWTAAASKYLKSQGVKGIRFLDGNSRAGGEGTHNYVVFADEDIEITDMLYELDDEEADNEGRGSSPEERKEFIDRYANAAGLLRQYLLKRMSFDSLTQRQLDRIVYKLNNRPRKSLG